MKFQIQGTGTFDADNIDHAFFRLAMHFLQIYKGNGSDLFQPPTDIKVEPAMGPIANETGG